MLHRRLWGAAAFAGAIATCAVPGFAAEQTSRWLTPTMINARAHMFSPDLNFLTFTTVPLAVG